VTRFVDEYINACVATYPCVSAPRWSTDLMQVDSGAEAANQRWENVLHRFHLPDVVREMETFNAIRDHWLVMRGPFHIWPFRDPLDFASVALVLPNTVPTISAADQVLGVADGFESNFQLVKLYSRGAQSYSRKIELPVLASVLLQGSQAGSPTIVSLPPYSVSRPGGVVTFDYPPPAGTTISGGFLFDVPVRFESDDAFEGVVRDFGLGGTADLTFIETRLC
jgi:Uncharacterized conserved protein